MHANQIHATMMVAVTSLTKRYNATVYPTILEAAAKIVSC